jgi:glycosyltransferase involved in cell wall biosynthesis
MSLSVCYILKNEGRTIRKSLESIVNILPHTLDNMQIEIVIVDTGSTDETKGIIKEFWMDNTPLKVLEFDFEWINDFSAARNFAVSKCTGDWILILDGDEAFYEHEGLKTLMSNELAEVWELVQRGVNGQMCRQFRLFKNHLGIKYTGARHETPDITGRNKGKSDVSIIHFGKELSENDHENKMNDIIGNLAPGLQNDYYKGIHYLRSGGHAEALQLLNNCIRQLEPGLKAFVYLQVGGLYMDIAKMYEFEAVKNYTKSFEYAPNQNLGHLKLFEYYKLKGKHKEAELELDILSTRNQYLSDLQNDILLSEEKLTELKNLNINQYEYNS